MPILVRVEHQSRSSLLGFVNSSSYNNSRTYIFAKYSFCEYIDEAEYESEHTQDLSRSPITRYAKRVPGATKGENASTKQRACAPANKYQHP